MTEKDKDSVLGKLSQAGAALSNLGGDVVKKVREDLSDNRGVDKLKADASAAVGSFKEADSRGDYVDAGKDLAKDAGSFLKSVAGSLKSAVSEVKDSEDATAVKSSLASVVESSRDKVDDTVDKVRAKKAARSEERAAEDVGEQAEHSESTNQGETDIIDGEVIPNPEDPQEPRV